MVNIILDNGAGKLKYGIAGETTPKSLTNATAKINKTMQYLVADQIDSYYNGSMLLFNRPFDRGYLNNWQSEIDVWNHILLTHLGSRPSDDSLTMTEPLFTPTTIQNDTNEVVFEYFGYKEHLRRPSVAFSAYEFFNSPHNQLDCCLVVESGFSFSHIVPFFDGQCQKHAAKRVNIGGKLLTNYLKEVVSYRQWNMMDEFVLMNQVKEELSYVSTNFLTDLKSAKLVDRENRCSMLRDHVGGQLKKQFVLPDFVKINRGFVLEDTVQPTQEQQVLTMDIERFAVPELLFTPSDIGIDQAGIAEASWQSLQAMHNNIHSGACAGNILLTGGNANILRYKERFEYEIRQLVNDTQKVEVLKPDQPELYAWRGASRFIEIESKRGTLKNSMVSKAEYLEYGHYYVNEKFSKGW